MTDSTNSSMQIGQSTFNWGTKTFIMGVLNVTPDSFSGDGVGTDVNDAVEQALRFQDWGADIIDVGGESTRPASIYPGSEVVNADDELARVLPVIDALVPKLDIPISIDTYKAEVARQAIKSGVQIVNDVWGLTRDPKIGTVVAEAEAPVILMHNQGHTRYDDVVPDVIGRLGELASGAIERGISKENIILDPGMGFGKTAQHNLEILRRLGEFRALGMPLLVGMSRKSTIGYVLDLPVDDRVEGTAATVAISIANGADIVRVHDVREMARVAKMTDAIVRGWEPPSGP
ncbi:MAG: dihydropteroate synthase [SAR202 cluster bacterium]|jgi:dihydropteroate synthase|nr:dihydropteroate synthase [SAR202 cluster bacterium]MDP6715454.1 dihydropteroate synthase [SAR202 cluster bacterium]